MRKPGSEYSTFWQPIVERSFFIGHLLKDYKISLKKVSTNSLSHQSMHNPWKRRIKCLGDKSDAMDSW